MSSVSGRMGQRYQCQDPVRVGQLLRPAFIGSRTRFYGVEKVFDVKTFGSCGRDGWVKQVWNLLDYMISIQNLQTPKRTRFYETEKPEGTL